MPILLATLASTIAGVTVVAIYQRISLLNAVVIGYGAAILASLSALMFYLGTLSVTAIGEVSTLLGNGVLLTLIFSFILVAGLKKWWCTMSLLKG